jgi:hypothetical protein
MCFQNTIPWHIFENYLEPEPSYKAFIVSPKLKLGAFILGGYSLNVAINLPT